MDQYLNRSSIELDFPPEDYLVVSEKQAHKLAEDYIAESLWAFNPDFLATHSVASELVFKAIQACEADEDEKSDAIRELISNWKIFVRNAIAVDGLGHFLSPYDGKMKEVYVGVGVNKRKLLVFRLN